MAGLEILDAHIHLHPDVENAWEFRSKASRKHSFDWTGTVAEAKAARSSAGIKYSNVMMLTPTGLLYNKELQHLGPSSPPGAKEDLRRNVLARNHAHNLWAAGIVAAEEGFTYFAGMDPVLMTETEMLAEVEEMLAKGAVGVKLAPVWVFAYGDDPRLNPLWDYCQSLEVPVLAQCGAGGVNQASGTMAFGHPKPFASALKRFPRLRISFAHLGMGAEEDLSQLTKQYPNAYTDLSLRLSEIPAGVRTPEQMADLIRSFNLEKVLFGSNFPTGDPAQVAHIFQELPLRPHELEKIANQNYRRFLGKQAGKAGLQTALDSIAHGQQGRRMNMAQSEKSAARLAAEKYVQTINEGRYSDVGDLFAENGIWVGFNNDPKKGRPAITAFYTGFLSQITPTIRVASFVSEGDMCVIELESKDLGTGEFRLAALDHITVDAEGKITRLAVYSPPRL